MASTLEWQRANDLQLGVSAAAVSVFINEGTANMNNLYVCTNDMGSDVVGLNTLVFVSVAGTNNVITLFNNYIFVGNPSNVATAVPMTGDASIAYVAGNGVLTLSNTGVTAGIYQEFPRNAGGVLGTPLTITVDAKGRVTSAVDGTTPGLANQVIFNNSGLLDGSPRYTFFDVISLSNPNTYNQAIYVTGPQIDLGDGMNPGSPPIITCTNAASGSGLAGSDLVLAPGVGDGVGGGGSTFDFRRKYYRRCKFWKCSIHNNKSKCINYRTHCSNNKKCWYFYRKK